MTERAKVVLTSRTQHFRSTAQVRTALGKRVATVAAASDRRIGGLLRSPSTGIPRQPLQWRHRPRPARFDLLADIEDLLGLARNPRMLAFIAALDEDRLRAVQQEEGRISAAELYQELVDYWLIGQANQRHRRAQQALNEQERLDVCTTLAVKLWTSISPTIPLADLSAHVSATLTDLADRGYSADQATQTVGSGTLLVRTDDGAFTFVHQSVMEWLVANAAARQLRDRTAADTLSSRRISRLMVDFLCDSPVMTWLEDGQRKRSPRNRIADREAKRPGHQRPARCSGKGGAHGQLRAPICADRILPGVTSAARTCAARTCETCGWSKLASLAQTLPAPISAARG